MKTAFVLGLSLFLISQPLFAVEATMTASAPLLAMREGLTSHLLVYSIIAVVYWLYWLRNRT